MDEYPSDLVPPTNVQTAKAAAELIALVESHLPQRFYRGEAFARMLCAAAIARMADTVDGLVLLRALYESVVRFMWVSIDPEPHVIRWGTTLGGSL